MVDMLVDEEARQEENTTGVCMEYFLKNGVLQYLVNVSEKMDYPEGIRGEAIRTIASMVDLLDDRFLVHNAVHKPTIKLLRFCVLDDRQSDTYHEDLVDLMYIICSKIHGFPALLNIFFHDKQWLTTPQKTFHHHDMAKTTTASEKNDTSIDQQQATPTTLTPKDDTGLYQQQTTPTTPSTPTIKDTTPKKPEYEFLLFTYLLRFVHREGRSGDFARTGLLFIMEMATSQLGDFILESDFATIMAAGLGALYSQLPRKLVIKDDSELSTDSATFLLGQDLDPRAMASGVGVVLSNSADFKLQLDSFLKLFEFCQDVLNRCPNSEISMALLQSIRIFFLQNILYPSILECSDIDGSSVAVITYIDLILQTLQQEDLADVVVKFLMDEENEQEATTTTTTTATNGDDIKHHSNVYAGIEFDQYKSSPYFTAAERFTLKDLILSRLKSSSQPTVIATLKLLKTLITRHCRYSLKLLSIYPDNSNSPFPCDNVSTTTTTTSTIISHHIKEIELYFSLITGIDQTHSEDILSVGYEEYLDDIEAQMEADWCYQNMVNMDGIKPGSQQTSTPKAERRRSFKYGKRPDDKGRQNKQQQQQQQQQSLCSAKTRLFRHRIRPTDPLLQILLGLLSHFFAQSSALNLALTGVISSLALCPYRSLEGWISFQESDRTTPDDILILDSSNITNGTNTTTATTSVTTSSSPSTFASSTTDTMQRLQLDDGPADKIRGNDIYAHFDYNQVDEDDEDDDRSVDFGVERNLSHTATTTQFKSFPPFFTLFRTLTQQVDFYRSEVDCFDTLLQERWQCLMFGTIDTAGTNGATMVPTSSTAMSSGASILSSWTTAPTTVTSSSPSTARRGSTMRPETSPSLGSSLFFGSPSISNISSMNGGNDFGSMSSRRPSVLRSPSIPSSFGYSTGSASTLYHQQQQQQYQQQQKRRPSILPPTPQRPPPNPSKSLSSSTTAAAMAATTRITPPTPMSTPATPITGAAITNGPLHDDALTPLAIHARKTIGCRLQPLFPSNFVIEPEEPILDLDEDDEDTFAPKDTNPSQSRRLDKSTEITLSMLLNNVVILEETIKELVAIMQVRRSNGIDRISYL
ncbi:Retinoic acid induced 16-like protein-domain-containing protein [Chlamydoabsidia padenii]|nr:Retinoic acid induced 16-like protein-domain-containing protein [Chlamydoabsidia padenii]